MAKKGIYVIILFILTGAASLFAQNYFDKTKPHQILDKIESKSTRYIILSNNIYYAVVEGYETGNWYITKTSTDTMYFIDSDVVTLGKEYLTIVSKKNQNAFITQLSEFDTITLQGYYPVYRAVFWAEAFAIRDFNTANKKLGLWVKPNWKLAQNFHSKALFSSIHYSDNQRGFICEGDTGKYSTVGFYDTDRNYWFSCDSALEFKANFNVFTVSHKKNGIDGCSSYSHSDTLLCRVDSATSFDNDYAHVVFMRKEGSQELKKVYFKKWKYTSPWMISINYTENNYSGKIYNGPSISFDVSKRKVTKRGDLVINPSDYGYEQGPETSYMTIKFNNSTDSSDISSKLYINDQLVDSTFKCYANYRGSVFVAFDSLKLKHFNWLFNGNYDELLGFRPNLINLSGINSFKVFFTKTKKFTSRYYNYIDLLTNHDGIIVIACYYNPGVSGGYLEGKYGPDWVSPRRFQYLSVIDENGEVLYEYNQQFDKYEENLESIPNEPHAYYANVEIKWSKYGNGIYESIEQYTHKRKKYISPN